MDAPEPEYVMEVPELPALAMLFEMHPEFGSIIEIILDCAFTPAGDNEDILNTGIECFLDNIMDDRLVDDREHLFWHRFGDR
jgi:hypothetical protein